MMTHCPGHGSISTPADIDKSLFLSFIIEFCVLILIAFISAFYYLSSNAWPTVEYSPLIVLIKSLSMSLKTIDDRLGSKQIDACAGGYRHILFESICVCVWSSWAKVTRSAWQVGLCKSIRNFDIWLKFALRLSNGVSNSWARKMESEKIAAKHLQSRKIVVNKCWN